MVDDVAWESPNYKTQDGNQFALASWPKATACSQAAARLIDNHWYSYAGSKGLMLAAVLAFKHHHTLELTPDVIFNTIMAGVSAHVNADPERFRGSFVAHEGKKKLIVRDNSLVMGSWSNRWDRPVAKLGTLVLENLSNEAARKALVTSFSSTGAREAAAHTMTFMDVVKGYFSYTILTDCGIPCIDVLGCTEDWESLAAAIWSSPRPTWSGILERAAAGDSPPFRSGV